MRPTSRRNRPQERRIVRVYLNRMRRLPRGAWLVVANTIGTTLGLAVVLVIYNLYLVALGYHEDFLGWFTALNSLAMSAGAFAAVPLGQRIGHGWCLALGSLEVVASCFGLGLATDPLPILGWGLINGFAAGQTLVPGGPLMLEHTTKADRPDAFAAYFASQSLSQTLGSVVAGVLPAFFVALFVLAGPQSVGPLRLTLLAGGVLSLTGVLPAFGLTRDGAHRPEAEALHSARETRPTRRTDRRLIVLFALISFLWALGIGIVLPFFNVYLADHLGGTTADVGLIFALNSAAMVVAAPFAPTLGRRLGAVTAIGVARLATVVLMLGLVAIPQLFLAAVFYVVRGGLVALTWPLDATFGLELVSARSSAGLTSAKSITFNVGWAVASLIGSQIIFHFGYPTGFGVSAAITLLAAVLHYRLFRRDDPHPGWRGKTPSLRVPTSG
jgi:MFS family permease